MNQMAYLLNHIRRGLRFAAFPYRALSSQPAFIFSEEVARAKLEDKPIVALESTIITHGMPYPKNVETALEVENIIRKKGVTPATVAILKGQLTVGLTEEQIQYLAQAKRVVKASRRDLAPICATGLDGATTVAGTIIAAELADLPVFVTGGIGGVHRQGESTLDVSADLNELGRCRTLVVCSGVKSILDIGRTLEYLETQGVCVCAFGDSYDFPAFYTTSSGYRAPHRVLSAQHAARVLHESRAMRLASGIVVAVPVPKEHAMDEKFIEEAITGALEAAKKQEISGKEVTPFILSAVAKTTAGSSLDANIALVKNNAQIGAEIAIEYKKLKNTGNSKNAFHTGLSKETGKYSEGARRFHTSSQTRSAADIGEETLPSLPTECLDGDVLVIGGSNVDRTYRVQENQVLLDGSTHACKTGQCGGGVGRNMAEALWRMRGGRTKLLTAVGDDHDGQYIASIAPGLLLDGCIIKNSKTPTYAAVLDARGDCLLGLGDMDLHSHITIELVNQHIEVLKQAPIVIIDGNIPQATMNHVLKLCHELKKAVFFEPTDRRKAIKPLDSNYCVTYCSPNLLELKAIAHFLKPNLRVSAKTEESEIVELSSIALSCFKYLIITLGARGVYTSQYKHNKLTVQKYPVESLTKIKNVSGAGDCFASGFVHGLLLQYKEPVCVSVGFVSAKTALLSINTVPKTFPHINNNLEKRKNL